MYVLDWFEMVLWYNNIFVWDHSLSQYEVYVAVWNCLSMTYSDSIVLQVRLMFCCLHHMRTLDAACHISTSLTARNIDFNPSRQGAILPRLTLITVKEMYFVDIVKLNHGICNKRQPISNINIQKSYKHYAGPILLGKPIDWYAVRKLPRFLGDFNYACSWHGFSCHQHKIYHHKINHRLDAISQVGWCHIWRCPSRHDYVPLGCNHLFLDT